MKWNNFITTVNIICLVLLTMVCYLNLNDIRNDFNTFVIIPVEISSPFVPDSFHFSTKTIQKGRTEYYKSLTHFTECKSKNKWPGYYDLLKEISL